MLYESRILTLYFNDSIEKNNKEWIRQAYPSLQLYDDLKLTLFW